MSTDRITEGLHSLTCEISVDRQEFQRLHPRDGDDLLQALISHGYAQERRGRYAINEAGLRRLEAGNGETD